MSNPITWLTHIDDIRILCESKRGRHGFTKAFTAIYADTGMPFNEIYWQSIHELDELQGFRFIQFSVDYGFIH
jgi:hypothetical protein